MSVGFLKCPLSGWENAFYSQFAKEVVAVIFHIMKKVKVKVAQSCLTLCNPVDHTVRGILQTRTLEWVAVPFSRGSSQPGDWTQIFRIAEPLDRCKILPSFPTFLRYNIFHLNMLMWWATLVDLLMINQSRIPRKYQLGHNKLPFNSLSDLFCKNVYF